MKLRRNVLQPLRFYLDDEPTILNGVAERRDRYQQLTPLGDHHFATRPGAMLQDYTQDRRHSVMARLFQVANRIQSSVDTVVVFCQGESGLGGQALMHACCQPYWNHLSRADRGSKPRMFFIDSGCDNDELQGLLHLLGTPRQSMEPHEIDPWALMVLAPSASPAPDATWQLQPLFQALQTHVGHDSELLASRFMAVAPSMGPWPVSLQEMGIDDLFVATDEPPSLQCFGPLGLLPATLLGINVMELTAGAAWMSAQIARTDSEPDLVSRFLQWRDGDPSGPPARMKCRTWNNGLESWVRWMESVERLRVQDMTTPELEYGQQPNKEWDIIVDTPRFDPIFLGDSESAPSRIRQAIDRSQKTRRDAGIRIAELHLSVLDELHIGQLMQWHLLTSIGL